MAIDPIYINAVRSDTKLPSSVGNQGFSFNRFADTLLGLGSIWASVELEKAAIKNAYANAGQSGGVYTTPGAIYQTQPGVPYQGASMFGNIPPNMIFLGAIIIGGVYLFQKG